ncbi:hypothetical protein BgiBS90_004975 [Biomphalaria glabrata]|nr:hypothetical protein BgiBS90_004975 [Biomphalaria glabrata]
MSANKELLFPNPPVDPRAWVRNGTAEGEGGGNTHIHRGKWKCHCTRESLAPAAILLPTLAIQPQKYRHLLIIGAHTLVSLCDYPECFDADVNISNYSDS